MVEKKLTAIRDQIQEVADAKRVFINQYGRYRFTQLSAIATSYPTFNKKYSLYTAKNPKRLFTPITKTIKPGSANTLSFVKPIPCKTT